MPATDNLQERFQFAIEFLQLLALESVYAIDAIKDFVCLHGRSDVIKQILEEERGLQ